MTLKWWKRRCRGQGQDRTTVSDEIDIAEYVDMNIITGFLQPCIEAALHLGCTPRRASRSQRNINSRCYLSQDSTNLDLPPQYQVFMKPNNFAPKNLPIMTFHNDVLSSPQEKCHVSKYFSYPLCYSLQVPYLPISNNVTDSYKSKYSRPVGVKDATLNGIIFGGCDLSLPSWRCHISNSKRTKIRSSNNKR
ncbi:hypothetical protein Bca52824_012739 [Brassica carinata]|uniref:Uncharacterized protein n=1 Tax=Brassica carinata TaxID=52824 RepID=A0A8X7VY20_BRACI|nr:hypothetical protein Bca52824_012739 [Brassica carinata]